MMNSQDAKMPVMNSNEDWFEESFDLVKYMNDSPGSGELNTPVIEQNPFPYGFNEKDQKAFDSFPSLSEDGFEFEPEILQNAQMYPQNEFPYGSESVQQFGSESPAFEDMRSSSRAGLHFQTTMQPQMPFIKQEEPEIDFSRPSSIAPSTVASMEQNDAGEYVPKIKPRKYHVKPESERSNPTYKQKRAKNNDAVRKSRNKAKLAQVQRDNELREARDMIKNLQNKEAANKTTMSKMSTELNELRQKVRYLEERQRCGCNGFR